LDSSRDPEWAIGAILVHEDERQVSMGYNGLVRGVPEIPENWENRYKKKLVVHAERNAMMFSQFDMRGSTLYVPLKPCSFCLGDAVNNGIKRVVWLKDPAGGASEAYYGPEWDEFAKLVDCCELPMDMRSEILLESYGLDGSIRRKR